MWIPAGGDAPTLRSASCGNEARAVLTKLVEASCGHACIDLQTIRDSDDFAD
ncbi:MAG: hypothetical protein OXN89_27220 [Bryobacterales bacterium]|nr:hypothetical protein [Bryobacterales bacterium]